MPGAVRAALPAVFFDLMGTLVDEDSDLAAHELLMRAVRDRFSLEDRVPDLLGEYHLLGSDQFEEERSAGKRSTPSFTRAYTATFVAMMQKRGVRPSAEDEAWFHDQYFACHRKRVKLTPDAARTLAKVRKLGVHVGLVSDVDKVLLEDHLDFLGLRDAFDSVTSAEAARAMKPDARIFAFALRQAGAEPREALMVGDSLERDVDGARAAGMHAVLIDRHGARVYEPKLRSLRGVPRLAKRVLGL